jgi:glucose-6-phosphate isomerase
MHTRGAYVLSRLCSLADGAFLQVSMESNGKGVDIHGERLRYKAGEVDFGEPGTNGQHSFYQLIHQGRVVPAEFIGVIRSQQSVYLKGEIVSNHDELMCNFFAQADALALGKSPVELRSENVPDPLIPHKTFTGNRPSMSIMLPELNAYSVGQLLSLYENRIAVQVGSQTSCNCAFCHDAQNNTRKCSQIVFCCYTASLPHSSCDLCTCIFLLHAFGHFEDL